MKESGVSGTIFVQVRNDERVIETANQIKTMESVVQVDIVFGLYDLVVLYETARPLKATDLQLAILQLPSVQDAKSVVNLEELNSQ